MTPTPLDKIGLRWHDHKSALWWLALLYRRPAEFEKAIEKFDFAKTLKIMVGLSLQVLIYVILLCIGGRLLIFGLLEIPVKETLTTQSEILSFHLYNIIRGIVLGIALGSVWGITITPGVGIAFGLAVGFSSGITFGLAIGFTSGIVSGIMFGLAFGIASGIVIGISEQDYDFVIDRIVSGALYGAVPGFLASGIVGFIFYGSLGGILGGILALFFSVWMLWFMSEKDMVEGSNGISFGIACGIFGGIGAVGVPVYGALVAGGLAHQPPGGTAFPLAFTSAFGFVMAVSILRAYYQPLFLWLSWSKQFRLFYRFHPVAWDNLCRVPFPMLDRLLVAYTGYAPESGKQEIERLIQSYPSQRHAALRAQTIFLAHQAAHEKNLTKLEALLAPLPEGKKGFLVQTPRLREMVGEIARIQVRLNTVNRPVLRDPIAQMLRERIENFRHQIGGFEEPLASEFRLAATHWLEIAQKQVQEAQAILTKESSPGVFRAGDPVNREQEAFVPRYGVVGDLEKKIMLSTGCPGLVLYGRRRMGKSTILNNLNGFLPDTVAPVFISMQDPQAFTSLADWVSHLLQKLSAAVALPSAIINTANDLTGFMRVLATYNTHLQETNKRILLAIDEYENLDRKIGEKVFPEDLLATIRESIQTHRNITWIFSGSHEITELKHAEWPSYLVSARTIEVPMFTMAETRLLLTEPLKFSPLFKDESKRPRFEPGFWGENGIERIQREAGGWPHLVQLIAETIVDVINDEDKRQVDDELYEAALNKAIVSGHNVLYQLLRGECTLPGEWEYLSAFRSRETQPLPGEEALYVSLRRRLLMEEANGEWRLRVPLMARWLKQRG